MMWLRKLFGRYGFCCMVAMALMAIISINPAYAMEEDVVHVLILNSYHKGLAWTDQETNGVVNGLIDEGIHANIAIEYMDWKNHPSQENIKYLYALYKLRYSKQPIDVVITTDDAALEFALAYREELFSKAPIVFCGVNKAGIRRIIKENTDVTGVAEIIDPENTFRAALKINKDIQEVFVLFDNSESGISTGDITIQAIKEIKPEIKINTLHDKSLDEIYRILGEAPDDSVVIITTYYTDSKGMAIGFEKFSEKVSKSSRVPVYHLYDFALNTGVLGGSMVSGKHQGELAARLASRIVRGEMASDIPIHYNDTTHMVFDSLQLKRFNVNLHLLPENSEIVNEKKSFFQTYKSLVIGVSLVFIILLGLISILIINLKRIKGLEQILVKNNKDLIQLNKELLASEDKLKTKLQELTQTQEELLSSEKRYSLLFNKMLNSFLVLEPIISQEGKITDILIKDINPSFEERVKKERKDIVNKTWSELTGYTNANLQIYKKVLESGEAERFETYYYQTDNYYLINAFKISSSLIGVISEDITNYKKAIMEIKKLNEELELRVDERTTELQKANKELENFSYTISHDLKAPLRAVEGYSRIILEDHEENLAAEVVELLNIIRNICNDMVSMINKLLLYSTTSKADMHKEEVDTEALVLEVYNSLKSACHQRKVSLNIETRLPKVMADRVLLKQVIYNILSNAFKFTQYKELAVFEVGCTITEEEYIFYVRDNGVGFDREYASKLFSIFQRLHSSEEFEGSGIGLAAVLSIIQKHGGRTWIEGGLDQGATVYFTLPFK